MGDTSHMTTSDSEARNGNKATETLSASTATPSTEPVPRSRLVRVLRRTLVVVAVVTLLFYAVMGWTFSSKIRHDAFDISLPGAPDYEIEVLAVGNGNVTLSLESGNDHLTDQGIRGVAWPDGYGQIGTIVSRTNTDVTRTYLPITGKLQVGALLDIDGWAFPGDPQTAHGIAFETIEYSSDVGTMNSWYVAGSSTSWVIVAHGKSGTPREALRVLPTFVAAGYHVLAVEYRNDEGAPPDPSGVYQYGLTEWQDVQGAVSYATENGAENIALMGYSMGGGIVASFLLESDLVGTVDAVVLDSPMLNFGATIDLGAANTSLPVIGLPVPQSVTNLAKLIAAQRYDVAWKDLDYLDRMASVNTPILVFHSSDDSRVPIATSRELQENNPGLVRLVEFAEAGHTRSWNADPDRYQSELVGFLAPYLG